MLRQLFALLTILLLVGCASASQIMQGYVGKSVADAIMDYGPPADAFDLTPKQRAFVWRMRSSYVMPGHSRTTGKANAYSSGNYASGMFNSNTTFTPAQNVSSDCNYVLYAEKTRKDIEGPAAWTVVGYKSPKSNCEYR